MLPLKEEHATGSFTTKNDRKELLLYLKTFRLLMCT